MTTNTPRHVIVTDDNGIPSASMDVDVIQSAATRLAYDMAANSADPAALDAVAASYLAEVGVDTFGYVTAAALRLLTTCVLEPALQVVDETLPTIPLRAQLADAAHNANTTLGAGA